MRLQKVIWVSNPSLYFIFLPLRLISKHNRGFQQIYYLFHPKKILVYNYISDRADKLRYLRFQEVLDLILKVYPNSINIK